MALINTGSDYVRSGDNFVTRLANKASFIPVIGGWIAGGVGWIGTWIDTAGWLFRGKFASAATVFASGTVSNALNAATGGGLSNPLYWLNVGSGVVSGNSIGTHGRALTEGVIGTVTGALGMRPTVLRSYTAGVGSIGGNGQSGPGYYATRAANERGQDPNAMWNNYRNGSGADHVAALEGSRATGPNYRGA